MAVTTVYASKDASARENDDSWSGWDAHHPVGTSPAGFKYCSFVYMPLSFSGWTGVTSASLWLRGRRPASGYHVLGDASGNTRTLTTRRMVSDWGEGLNRGEGVWSSSEAWKWSNRRTGSAIIAGSDEVFNGYVEGTWYEIDVTDAVLAWYNGSPNYGFLLTFASSAEESSMGDALEFYSRHAGVGYQPYLEITYTANVAPSAPIGLSPSASALVNTLAPNLTGTAVDSDIGDYISANEVAVYQDDATTQIWLSQATTTSFTKTFSRTYAGPALLGNTFYQWKARTRDKGGLWSPFSALQRFKTNTPPNPPALVVSQSPNNDLLTLSPTINVTHSDNDIGDSKMYGYRVLVQTSAGVTHWDSGDIDTSATPLTTKTFDYAGIPLEWGTSYTIKARTKDVNLVWGSYGTALAIKTHKTGVPINLSPVNETISGLVPSFTGERLTSAESLTSYQIILYATDGVTLLWDSGVLTTGIVSGASFSKAYTGTALAYSTTYKWKVRATSTIGGTGDYSTLQSFTTPLNATIPILTETPITNGRVTTLTPTLTGTRTSAAFTNYQIELYPATATSTDLGTFIWDSGNIAQTSATTFNKVYNGLALDWNTTYRWRARVGAPTLGTWTGLATFTTDAAGTPTQSLPAANAWVVAGATNFTGSSSGGESIIGRQIQIYNAATQAIIYDSGLEVQAASTTFTKSIDLSVLPTGTTYRWRVRYQKSTGPTGPYSDYRTFRLNAAPSIPISLYPTPGTTIDGDLTPVFRAEFVDADETSNGDQPTSWEIEIRNNTTDALLTTKTITSGLTNSVNEYQWLAGDPAFAFSTTYKWRTRFTDSLSVVGSWSSYQTFIIGQPPVILGLTPSNGSNVITTRPLIEWVYSDPGSLPQAAINFKIIRASNSTTVYSIANLVTTQSKYQVPAGYLQYNGETFTIELRVKNNGGLWSTPFTSSFQLQLDAPPAVQGLSATIIEEQSRVFLEWDASSLGTKFVTYVIYRRDVGDTDWTMIGTRKPETNVAFSDWYAGQSRQYEYRVTVVKLITSEPDLESPDSDIVSTALQSDVWMVIGKDRAEEHVFELPVSSESHSRPVQQEEFEPLGSNRKAIVRGFVLGHEGTLDVVFQNTEAQLAKEQVEYLLYYAGPHILKNPFGDVFDVTFGSPDYSYGGGGILSATLTWTEVGATNNPGLTPDEFLAQIGAE